MKIEYTGPQMSEEYDEVEDLISSIRDDYPDAVFYDCSGFEWDGSNDSQLKYGRTKRNRNRTMVARPSHK